MKHTDCEECVGCDIDVRKTRHGTSKRLSCIYKHTEEEMNSGHLCEDFEIAKHVVIYELIDEQD